MKAVRSTETEKTIPSARILEMRMKIQNKAYITGAIHRIALVLSRQLVEDNDFTGADHRSKTGKHIYTGV